MSNKLPLKQSLERLSTNEEKFEKVVNGGEEESVELGGKNTPTLRNLISKLTDTAFSNDIVQRAISCSKYWALQANKISTSESFIATGTTEARTLADRAADIVNGQDYGMKGDGFTDNTYSFQNAVDTLRDGKTLYITAGNYLLDPVFIDRPLAIYLDPRAKLILRSVNTKEYSRSVILNFSSEASGSMVIGGIFDGAKSVHAPSYPDYGRFGGGPTWEGIRLDYCHDFTIKGTKFQNFVQNGFRHAGGDNLVVEDITFDSCSRAFQISYAKRVNVRNIKCINIGNGTLPVFQHGCDMRFLEDSALSGLFFSDFAGTTYGLEQGANCFGVDSCKNCHFSNLALDGYVGDIDGARGISWNSMTRCTLSQFSILGYEYGLVASSSRDCTFTNFVIDGQYKQKRKTSAWPGMLFSIGGVFSENATLAGETAGNSSCKDCIVSNGIVTRCSVGIRNESSQINFDNIMCIGNRIDGFEIIDVNKGTISHPSQKNRHNRIVSLTNIKSITNGDCGVLIKSGDVIRISNSDILNNGQDVLKTRKNGIMISPDGDTNNLIITDCHVIDNQEYNLYNVASYVPGYTDEDNCISIIVLNPSRFNIGQYIILKNASVNGDEKCKIVDINIDYFRVQFDSPITLLPNLGRLGIGYSKGRALYMPHGGMIDSVPYALYIKHPLLNEYRNIRYVNSDNEGILNKPFSEDIPENSDLHFVRTGIEGIPSQRYGFNMDNNVTGPVLINNNIIDDNSFRDTYFGTFGLSKLSSGSEIIYWGELNVSTTSDVSNLVSNIPYGFQCLGIEIEIIETITGFDGTFKLSYRENSVVLLDVISPWDDPVVAGTVVKRATPNAPAFSGAGRIDIVITSGEDRRFDSGKVRWRLNLKRVTA